MVENCADWMSGPQTTFMSHMWPPQKKFANRCSNCSDQTLFVQKCFWHRTHIICFSHK